MHLQRSRSESFFRNRLRETSPLQSLGASDPPISLPGGVDARSSLQLPQHNLGGASCRVDRSSIGSLQEASEQAQELAVSFPDLDGTAPALADEKRRSLSATTSLRQLASEESTRQKLQEQVPPPTQLWSVVTQLRAEIEALHQVVRKLAELTFGKVPPTLGAELEEESAHNKTNRNNNNNDNDHNKNSQEPSLNSLDLDDTNPESNSDLDASSFGSFSPIMGVESSLGSLDQHEADLSFDNLGHQMMTIGSSLGSLDQQEEESSDSFDQEGMMIGTSWDPSLAAYDPSLDQHRDKTKPKKRVTFDEATLTAYNEQRQTNKKQQNKGSHPESSQLEQLEHNKTHNKDSYNDSLEDELPEQDNKSTTTQACWNELQQEQKMQQQPATASEKRLEHRICNNNSLESEDESLGNLESQTQTQQACRSPKHNTNTSSLGIRSKNKAAWGIMIDTGAAISLAPMSFAPETELSPLESTLQLRSVTGKAIPAYGRRVVNMIGSQLSFPISFVIAEVEHALLGMDIFMQEELSLQRGINNEHYLVNKAGERTQLQQRGPHLYIEACPCESGLITCRGSSLPEQNGSLLDDRESAQDAAWQEELCSREVTTSGGACGTSFYPENLRQQQAKNTATLGTTALPDTGAKKERRNLLQEELLTTSLTRGA